MLLQVTHPGKVLPEVLAASINAMGCILSYNGMSGISLPHEPVDSLTTMVGATEIGQSDPGWNNRMDMNPNIRHQHPNMHQQRGGGIHVSKVRQIGINHQIIICIIYLFYWIKFAQSSVSERVFI